MRLTAMLAAVAIGAGVSPLFGLTVPVAEDTSTATLGVTKVVAPVSGAAATLAVNGRQSALVRFALTNHDVVPAAITAANLKSALLRLYVVSASPAADVTIHAVTSTWSEQFAGPPVAAPTIDATILATIPAAALKRRTFVSVDLTPAVAAALQAGDVFGFALQTSNAAARIFFASKEGPAAGEAAELDLDADLSSGGTAGTSLTLSGNLILPVTTGSTGILFAGNAPLLHDYGNSNFFGGLAAGNFTMTGSYNAGVGFQALHANTSGLFNTATGYLALAANTSGFSNTAAGAGALQANTTGSENSAGSDDALAANTTGVSNTAFGYASLFSNLTGDNNTALGDEALFTNTAANNTAIGFSALFSNTTGTNNLAAGVQALYSNQTGNSNTANGVDALFSNVSGRANTAAGLNAMYGNTSGYENVASGAGALVANTTGYENGAMGFNTLSKNTTGNNNTAVGAYALSNNVIGAFNIAIGAAAGANTVGNNNICIGNAGDTTSGVIWIGDSNQSAAYIAGIYGASANTAGVPVNIASNGKLYTAGSSRRFKDSILDMDEVSAPLLQLRPVTFHYKPGCGPEGVPQFGLIAEEVAAVAPELVARDARGEIYTVRYDAVNAMLLNEFLKEHQRVQHQAAQLTQQQEAIGELEARLSALEARVSPPSPPQTGVGAVVPAQ